MCLLTCLLAIRTMEYVISPASAASRANHYKSTVTPHITSAQSASDAPRLGCLGSTHTNTSTRPRTAKSVAESLDTKVTTGMPQPARCVLQEPNFSKPRSISASSALSFLLLRGWWKKTPIAGHTAPCAARKAVARYEWLSLAPTKRM